MYRQELHRLLTLLYEFLPHSLQGINSLRIEFKGGFIIAGASFWNKDPLIGSYFG